MAIQFNKKCDPYMDHLLLFDENKNLNICIQRFLNEASIIKKQTKYKIFQVSSNTSQ